MNAAEASSFLGLVIALVASGGCITAEPRKITSDVDVAGEGDSDAEARVCEEGVACDNGTGLEIDSCSRGFLVRDQCAGGRCVDMTFESPPGGHPLAGDWHISGFGFEPLGSPGLATVKASCKIKADGGLSMDDVRASHEAWLDETFGTSAEGGACVGPEGELGVELNGKRFRGYLGADADVFTLVAPGGALFVGTRLDGSAEAEQLDGTYRMVLLLERLAPTRASVFVGEVELDEGTWANKASFIDEEGANFAIGPFPSGQFDERDGVVRVDLSLQRNGGPLDVSLPLTLEGRIVQAGRAIVGTTLDPAGRPASGWFMMVRVSGDDAPALDGNWGFGSGFVEAGSPRMHRVQMGISDGNLFGEIWTVDAEPDSWSSLAGWISSDDDQRVSTRLVFDDGNANHHSGSMAEGGQFGLLIPVLGVPPTSSPAVLEPEPAQPGVALLLKLAPTAVAVP